MNQDFIARASISINVAREKVWQALVTPEAIRQYMFGTTVISNWQEGGSIVWKGEWKGRAYEDHGVILKLRQGEILQYTHFSPLSGLPDQPDNYHTVTIELSDDGDQTLVSLTQDNNPTEEARAHSQQNWEMMLAALKKFLEQ